MEHTVQARLDAESHDRLQRLTRQLGVSQSEIVRRGIRLVEATSARRRTQVIGVGRFASGISDLGSNKEHLKGFGS